MKKLSLILFSCFVCIFCCAALYLTNQRESEVNSSSFQSKHTVVIDAGHGGKDAGTSGVDGTPEKAVNLEIAKALYDYLSVCGIKSDMIRNGDYELYAEGEGRTRSDLYNRLDYINSVDNSVLISIHQNHFENEAQWGTQIWYSANTEESKKLADGILSNVKFMLQPENKRENKVSDNSYYLLYKASVPSVMVECGFMSNNRENFLLQQTDYQNDMAFSIMSGIADIV